MRRQGRLVHEGGIQGPGEGFQVLDLVGRLPDDGVVELPGRSAQSRERTQAGADGGEIARARHAEGDPAGQPGEVAQVAELRAEPLEQVGVGFERGHRVEATVDLRRPPERSENPLPQKVTAHGRDGSIEGPQERALRPAVGERLDQLERPHD